MRQKLCPAAVTCVLKVQYVLPIFRPAILPAQGKKLCHSPTGLSGIIMIMATPCQSSLRLCNTSRVVKANC